MCNIIKFDTVFDCSQLDAQIDAIQQELSNAPSSETCRQLFQKLDKTSQALQSLKERASQGSSPFSAEVQRLDKKVKTLFGSIHTQSVNSQVVEMRDEARGLAASTQMDKREVCALKRSISTMRCKHALSPDNERILGDIETSLKKVDLFLEGPPATPTKEDYELSMQLFEIFDLFSMGRKKDAQTLLNQLPVHVQEGVDCYMKQHSKEAEPIFKALIATANKLVHNGKRYPSSREIVAMQRDLLHIRKQKGESALCAFASISK